MGDIARLLEFFSLEKRTHLITIQFVCHIVFVLVFQAKLMGLFFLQCNCTADMFLPCALCAVVGLYHG